MHIGGKLLFGICSTYTYYLLVQFVLQIQGKFKRQPRGVLYAGSEVSEPMKLGLLAKGYVCHVVIPTRKRFFF